MSVTPSQLSEIHKELIEFFISHPTISVNPAKGDPPEQYDISYQIGGMSKTETGEIKESFGHTINLTIPFGFPHFPPSCKPAGNIFHPDFDPAAICIGSFWDNNQSLPELIINIGRMINGETYSTTNVFNEEAGTWYKKFSDRFPLSNINWPSTSEIQESTTTHDVDTLDDSDLASEFNFHDIALDNQNEIEEISINDAFPDVDFPDAPKDDFSEISLLNNKRMYFKLQETLKGSAHKSEELQELAEKSAAQIDKAKDLYDNAKASEDAGDPQQALLLLERTASTVADFPSIKSDIKRVQQTLTLLDDISPDPHAAELPSTDAAYQKDLPRDFDTSSAPRKQGKTDQNTQQIKKTISVFEEKKQLSKLTLFSALTIFTIAASGGGYFWYSSSSNLEAAEEATVKCKTYLKNSDFPLSKKSCEQGLLLVDKIKFIKQSETKSIKDELTRILESEELTQGLAGNVLFDGKYLSKAEAENQKLFNDTLESATQYYEKEQWPNAIESYSKLIEIINSGGFPTTISKEDIDHQIRFCRFRMKFDAAETLMSEMSWDKAIEQFQSITLLLDQLPEKANSYYKSRVLAHIDLCKFNILKKKGDTAFSESRWQDASAFYTDAVASLNQKDQILPEAINILKSNNKRAQLYKTITEGNLAYRSADWDQAISAYDKADSFLAQNHELLSAGDLKENRKKLGQIRLQALITREQQRAEAQVAEKQHRAARATYLTIIRSIDVSPYGQGEKFTQIKSDTLNKVSALDKDIDKQDKIDYLKENFQSLFITNYPASNIDNLTNPIITFTKQIKDKQVFRMQCSETGRGRPLTLVMFYAFSETNGNWELYSNQ